MVSHVTCRIDISDYSKDLRLLNTIGNLEKVHAFLYGNIWIDMTKELVNKVHSYS
jgi:hypothetical protein